MKRQNHVLVTAGLMVGLLVAALDQTIVDTAFPRMIADLGGTTIFTWVITAYLLASTVIVPVVGKLADIYGRRIFYLLGMAVFLLGSALCGAAQTMTQLIIFRGVQGIGAGMLMPIAFTIIGDLYPGEQRAKMQGLFGGVFGLASIMGPKLGGWLTHTFTWRWVFYINLPIGIIAGALIALHLVESKGERRPIDWVGAFTVTAGVTLLLLGLIQGGVDHPWLSWPILTYFGLAAILLAVFVYTEQRVAEPVLDFSLFRNRTFTTMSLVAALMGVGLFGAVIFVPWFIQGVTGVNPNEAGNIMMPMMLMTVLFSSLGGRVALHLSYRAQMSLGFLVVLAGFYIMTGWSIATTQLQATLAIMVVGAGLGFIMPLVNIAVQNAFPREQRGVVTSAVMFFRQIGSTLGVTVFGLVFNHGMAAQYDSRLAPLLGQAQGALSAMPAAARAAFQALLDKPQSLIQVLLQPETAALVPPDLLPRLQQTVKVMMAESLHVVFWASIGVTLLGFAVSQWLGRASLRAQMREQAGWVDPAPGTD